MHMADALVSTPVALTTGTLAVGLIAISSAKIKNIARNDIVPLMGVMGAFVFAAQMINFAIPGTGSSGHIIGGILLAALLGPWAAFITLASVIMIQCLIFADGGLMALGCNLINMGAMSCLVAYPLIYRPLAGDRVSKTRISIASVTSCIVALELGALCVTAETELSGVTALSTSRFLALMSGIHLAIGLCEGIATAVVLTFLCSYKPDMLYSVHNHAKDESPVKERGKLKRKTKIIIAGFALTALILAAGFNWIASENPDGLEWSIEKITGSTEIGTASIPSTALMPDYDSTFAGIVGGIIVMALLWAICALLFSRKKIKNQS